MINAQHNAVCTNYFASPKPQAKRPENRNRSQLSLQISISWLVSDKIEIA